MPARKLRVLLVTSPYHSGVVEAAGTWMPLAMVYIAGAARAAGAEVEIYDAMSLYVTHDDIGRKIAEFKPDIVGTTAITATEPDARVICATAKAWNPEVRTVVGNVHATYCWEEILRDDPSVDFVVRGEGESTIAELVQAVAAGEGYERIAGLAYRKDGVPVANRPRMRSLDLDLFQPAFDLVDWPIYSYRPSPDGQLAIVSSARGCAQQCSFCSQQKFWGRSWRGRDRRRTGLAGRRSSTCSSSVEPASSSSWRPASTTSSATRTSSRSTPGQASPTCTSAWSPPRRPRSTCTRRTSRWPIRRGPSTS
jgi:anaerobic magnesium-protoporphyrin IX monomethyl ester cyclase